MVLETDLFAIIKHPVIVSKTGSAIRRVCKILCLIHKQVLLRKCLNGNYISCDIHHGSLTALIPPATKLLALGRSKRGKGEGPAAVRPCEDARARGRHFRSD